MLASVLRSLSFCNLIGICRFCLFVINQFDMFHVGTWNISEWVRLLSHLLDVLVLPRMSVAFSAVC